MAEVRRVLRNPADVESGYKFWSHGLIEAFGDAPPISFSPRWPSTDPVVDAWVLPGTWSAPRGLVLTDDGARHGFGSPSPSGWGGPLTGGAANRQYRWLVMDPTGTGRGWVITARMQYQKIGTGTANMSPAPPVLSSDIVRDFIGSYATGQWLALAGDGQMWADTGIASPSWSRRPGMDAWRRIALPFGWEDDYPALYVANRVGEVFDANAAEPAYRGPVLAAHGDTVRAIDVISDGTGGDPLIIELTQHNGARYRYTVSSPPTVTVVAPTGTVTDTRTPEGGWVFSDPNRDAQVEAQVAWFTDAQYSAGGFDPATSTAVERQTITERRLTRATPATPLDSDTYRMYVRAQDSAGQWSSWAHGQFVVDVTPPSPPTIDAAPTTGYRVELTISGGEDAVEIQHSDDDGETWVLLRGSPVAPSGTVWDDEAPFNVERLYRAQSIDGDLRSDWTTPVAATLTETTAWVVSVPGGDHHLEVRVPPGLRWAAPVLNTSTDTDSPDSPVIVVRRGRRSPRLGLPIRYSTLAERQAIDAMFDGRRTLLLRAPAGIHWYIEMADGDATTALDGITWGAVTVPITVVGRP